MDAVSKWHPLLPPRKPWAETPPIEPLEAAGPWSTEKEALAAFDEIVTRIGLFKIRREVPGRLLQPRIDQEDKNVRIDRILTPTDELFKRGWSHGPIGVEAKSPGEKLGPCISQVIDYSRSVFTIKEGYRILLSWIFIWPVEKAGSTIASVLAQNRLGTAWPHRWERPWGGLYLYSGETHVARFGHDGSVELGEAKSGRRTGSR